LIGKKDGYLAGAVVVVCCLSAEGATVLRSTTLARPSTVMIMACRTHNAHPRRLCRAVFNHSNSTKKSISPGSGAWPSAHGKAGRQGKPDRRGRTLLLLCTDGQAGQTPTVVRKRADASPRSLGTGLLLLRPANEAHAPYSLRPQQYTQLPSVTRAYSAERACSACELAACLTSRCYR
jgi:hypothetical protein